LHNVRDAASKRPTNQEHPMPTTATITTTATGNVTGSADLDQGQTFTLAGGTPGNDSNVHVWDASGTDQCEAVCGQCPLKYGTVTIQSSATAGTYTLGSGSNGELTVGSG
jgi:hypothetical protein